MSSQRTRAVCQSETDLARTRRKSIFIYGPQSRNLILETSSTLVVDSGHLIDKVGCVYGDDGLMVHTILTSIGVRSTFFEKIMGTPSEMRFDGERLYSSVEEAFVGNSCDSITIVDGSGHRTWFQVCGGQDSCQISPSHSTSDLVYVDYYSHDYGRFSSVLENTQVRSSDMFINLGRLDLHGSLLDNTFLQGVLENARWAQISCGSDGLRSDEESFFKQFSHLNVICTYGPKGAEVFSEDGRCLGRPATLGPIRSDSAGAAFSAGFLIGISEGKNNEECLKFANGLAGFFLKNRSEKYETIKEAWVKWKTQLSI